MNRRWREWPFLATAAGLLLAAGLRLISDDKDTVGGIGVVAGLIVLGAWIATEIHNHEEGHDDED